MVLLLLQWDCYHYNGTVTTTVQPIQHSGKKNPLVKVGYIKTMVSITSQRWI